LDVDGARVFRESIGLEPDDRMILQPTRIVQRKGIEHAIELVKKLKDSRNKLVVSHEAGDEGFEYVEWLKEYAHEHEVNLRLVTTRIADPWSNNGNGQAEYSLWDVYPFADFITYPSLYEGFGNAFLEAVYFCCPIVVNSYSIYTIDIKPKGFSVIELDGYVTDEAVRKTKKILIDPELRKKMVTHNYETARKYYSYSVLGKKLKNLISDCTGCQDIEKSE
jgi:glycosyltransferase involved in cell wall biosynthesis